MNKIKEKIQNTYYSTGARVAVGGGVGTGLALVPAPAHAEVTAPVVNFEDAGEGILSQVTSALPVVLAVFGAMAGIYAAFKFFSRATGSKK